MERDKDVEEDVKNGANDAGAVVVEENLDKAKDPCQTDGEDDGDIHTELTLDVLLVSSTDVCCSLECVSDFSRHKEEEDGVGRHNEKSWNEESN